MAQRRKRDGGVGAFGDPLGRPRAQHLHVGDFGQGRACLRSDAHAHRKLLAALHQGAAERAFQAVVQLLGHAAHLQPGQTHPFLAEIEGQLRCAAGQAGARVGHVRHPHHPPSELLAQGAQLAQVRAEEPEFHRRLDRRSLNQIAHQDLRLRQFGVETGLQLGNDRNRRLFRNRRDQCLGEGRLPVLVHHHVVVEGGRALADHPVHLGDARVAAQQGVGCQHLPLGLADRGEVRGVELDVELVALDPGKELRRQGREGAEADQRQGDGGQNRQAAMLERKVERSLEQAAGARQVQAVLQPGDAARPLLARQHPAGQRRGDGQGQTEGHREHDDHGDRDRAHEVAGRAR